MTHDQTPFQQLKIAKAAANEVSAHVKNTRELDKLASAEMRNVMSTIFDLNVKMQDASSGEFDEKINQLLNKQIHAAHQSFDKWMSSVRRTTSELWAFNGETSAICGLCGTPGDRCGVIEKGKRPRD